MNSKFLVSAAAAGMAVVAAADIMDRERGIKIGERMTLLPSVSFSYTYDSNVDSSKHSKSGSQWSVNPSLDMIYRDDNWKADLGIYYTYHAYNRYTSQLNSSTYGQRIRLDWADSQPDEAGWRVLFSERFDQISQDDDMSDHGGRGIGRDRKQLTVQGVVERRINERMHGNVNADYYLLDYDNNVNKYAPLYGWKRAKAGAEVGYMASRWLDLIVSAGYMWYWQDNDRDYGNSTGSRKDKRVADDSRGWTVMGGFASRATERISYKLLGGYSRFDYGKGTSEKGGFVYECNFDWQVDNDNMLHVMALASSYFQPSERDYGASIKVYSFSAGVGKGFIRNKLRATCDLMFRHETHEYITYAVDDYDSDIWTGRIGLRYVVNRFLALYGRIEYQSHEADGRIGNGYNYDRWRGTLGFSLSY